MRLRIEIPAEAVPDAIGQMKCVIRYTVFAVGALAALWADNGKKPTLVSPHQLSSQQRFLLKGSGDRYEKAGKERLVLSGSIDDYNNGSKSGSASARITIEFPDQAKIENLVTGERVNFDGSVLQKSTGQASKQELDLMETMVNDSTDGFFAAALRGAAVRSLGTHFKTNDAGNTVYCNLFELYDTVKIRGATQVNIKTYCFDSTTGLLRTVSYESGGVKVQTRFSNWTTVDGQAVPQAISRTENGKQTFGFAATIAATASTALDGLFGKP